MMSFIIKMEKMKKRTNAVKGQNEIDEKSFAIPRKNVLYIIAGLAGMVLEIVAIMYRGKNNR